MKITTEYNASSIKILTAQEIEENYLWVKAEKLATKYTLNSSTIHRALESCEMSGMDQQCYIDRYLEGDRRVQVTPEFVECYKEAMRSSKRVV